MDAFRVDTVKFVEHDFYHDFFHGQNGILDKAKETGRNDFLSLGEIFEASTPYNTEGEEKLIAYLGTKEKPELESMLNFPLQATMSQVFGGRRPTAELGFRLRKMMEMYPDPYRLGNFIENHDMAHFLAQANLNDLKQALFTMLTLPGIPVLYQGTEQAKVFQIGSNVRLSLQMASVSDTWLPTLGFDHVGFSIFIHLPGQEGG